MLSRDTLLLLRIPMPMPTSIPSSAAREHRELRGAVIVRRQRGAEEVERRDVARERAAHGGGSSGVAMRTSRLEVRQSR